MDADTLPQISSFIIRFVRDETPNKPASYHGTVRHIQTAEEINFHEWREAVEFMHRFIQIEEMLPPSSPETPITKL